MAQRQSTTNTRWIPAEEQKDLLEVMYREGIRNPTPVQIDEIAGRLRAYGTVEAKSVFYWFQNRKSRDRQRQKQERVSSMNQGHAININVGNSSERRTLQLFPLQPTGMARANPQPVLQELRDEQNDGSSGGGSLHNFFHFIPMHPGH